MITRNNRFHGLGSLRYVHQKGKVVRGPLMVLKFVPNARRPTYRAAVVVSRKVSKSAVVRNRIRRRVYEIIRTELISKPYDLVFIIFSDQVGELPSRQLTKLIHHNLTKAGAVTSASRAIVEPKD